jgi:hypothetical protein
MMARVKGRHMARYTSTLLVAALSALTGIRPAGAGPVDDAAEGTLAMHGPRARGPMAFGTRPEDGLDSLLGLTDEQKALAKSYREEHWKKVRSVLEQQRRLHDDLERQLGGDNPNAALVGKTMIDLRAGMKTLEAMRTELDERILGMLDEQQRQQFETVRKMRRIGPPFMPAPRFAK